MLLRRKLTVLRPKQPAPGIFPGSSGVSGVTSSRSRGTSSSFICRIKAASMITPPSVFPRCACCQGPLARVDMPETKHPPKPVQTCAPWRLEGLPGRCGQGRREGRGMQWQRPTCMMSSAPTVRLPRMVAPVDQYASHQELLSVNEACRCICQGLSTSSVPWLWRSVPRGWRSQRRGLRQLRCLRLSNGPKRYQNPQRSKHLPSVALGPSVIVTTS